MFKLSSFTAAARAMFVRVPAIAIAAAVLSISAAAPQSSAFAFADDDIPFWERADHAKAAAKKSKRKHYAGKSLTKSYAKKSGKKKLGGYAEATEPKKYKKKGVRVAALGDTYMPQPKASKSLSGGSVRWVASAGCLDGNLKSIIYQVAAHFGPVTVSSTCRGKAHNRRVGGARRSKHLTGDAADFRVHARTAGLVAFVRARGAGGVKHYGGGLYHIDNGPVRSW